MKNSRGKFTLSKRKFEMNESFRMFPLGSFIFSAMNSCISQTVLVSLRYGIESRKEVIVSLNRHEKKGQTITLKRKMKEMKMNLIRTFLRLGFTPRYTNCAWRFLLNSSGVKFAGDGKTFFVVRFLLCLRILLQQRGTETTMKSDYLFQREPNGF